MHVKEITVQDGKFIGLINGVQVVKSSSRYYVERRLQELEVPEPITPNPFPINQRFEFVVDVVTMVAKKQAPSMIITGEGGLGKSYTVKKALESAGLRDLTEVVAESDIGSVVPSDKCFVIFKGFSTAKALYRTLYENRHSTIVFDDTDSILKDSDALNILKGALDSFDKRFISWNSEMRDDSVPRMFQFKGGVIFISNLSPNKIDQALKSRSMCIDLSMTTEQKVERMYAIIESEEFLPSVPKATKQAALELISDNKEKVKEISLRTLITVTKIAHSARQNWKSLATYMITN